MAHFQQFIHFVTMKIKSKTHLKMQSSHQNFNDQTITLLHNKNRLVSYIARRGRSKTFLIEKLCAKEALLRLQCSCIQHCIIFSALFMFC